VDKIDCVLKEASVIGDELHIDLWYPDVPDTRVRKFVIGLMDVRAADDIRVSYDKERDGWKIEQASKFEWDGDDEVCDPDWQEVSFVQAWGRENHQESNAELSGGEAVRSDALLGVPKIGDKL
jgi:hypothetical protein